jgi:hypothetical protein
VTEAVKRLMAGGAVAIHQDVWDGVRATWLYLIHNELDVPYRARRGR